MHFTRCWVRNSIPNLAEVKPAFSVLNHKDIDNPMAMVMRFLRRMGWNFKHNQFVITLAMQRSLEDIGRRQCFASKNVVGVANNSETHSF